MSRLKGYYICQECLDRADFFFPRDYAVLPVHLWSKECSKCGKLGAEFTFTTSDGLLIAWMEGR